MIESVQLLGVLPYLKQWLGESRAKRLLQDDRGQHAVTTILRAVNETTLYLASQSRGQGESREAEVQLSRLWTEAASALHGINDDLAQRCKLKGAFWAQPDAWTSDELRQARILLSQVAEDADALLGWDTGDN